MKPSSLTATCAFVNTTCFSKAHFTAPYFLRSFFICVFTVCWAIGAHAQKDSSNNTASPDSSASGASVNIIDPGGSCSMTGSSTVTAGNSNTYGLTCGGSQTADSWDATCGTVMSFTGSQATIKWNSSGCSNGTVTAYVSDGTSVTKSVTINPAPPPSISYTSLFTSSTFTRTIDLTKPVGTVAGAAGTTPTGGVTYSIPIYTPPGTNGLQPSVTLSYSSQAGPGIAGFGWNIGGLSVISRTGKNMYHNSIVGPVAYTTEDAFLLDGMRLNVITGSNGANGTEYAGEAETFAKIISYTAASANNPDWFGVTAKDGSKMEFGHTADSRILTDNSANVMLWRLNRIIDVNGNYIDFVYDNTNRNSRIKTIKYTGNVNTGLYASNSISFEYALRTDQSAGYDAGGSLASKYLLSKITVIADDDLIVKTYTLNYGFDNINSLLKEVIESGSDAITLNSTIFLYGDQPQNIAVQTTNALTGSYDFFSGDFNADGKTDLLAAALYYDDWIKYYSSYEVRSDISSSSSAVLYTKALTPQGSSAGDQLRNNFYGEKIYNFLASDYNGDGRDDILVPNASLTTVSSTEKPIKLNNIAINYTGSHNPSTGWTDYTTATFTYPAGGYQYNQKGNYFIPGDFDGDGNQDYILVLSTYPTLHYPTYGGPYYTYSYKAFFANPSTNEINSEILNFGSPVSGIRFSEVDAGSVARSDMILPADFDGDGKSEILVVNGTQASVLVINRVSGTIGYSFQSSIRETITTITKDCKIYPGDFNGDRKTDLLVRNGDGTWKIMYSTGTSFISSSFSFNQGVNITDHKIAVADFNGDGKTDILHGYNYYVNGAASTSKLSLYYSRGSSFYYEQYDYNNLLAYELTVGDFNGDGRSDILNQFHVSSPADFISFKSFGKERMLAKATDGFNNTTSFSYKTFTDKSDPDFYNRTISLDDPSNKNPYNYVQLPMYAVSSISAPNGIGGTNTTTFNYENAVIHRAAKGFLGFRKITAKDAASDITSITENEINTQFAVPYTVTQTSLLTSTAAVLSQSQITTSFTNLSTGAGDIRFFQKTAKVLSTNSLTGAATENTNTYDSYGNITTNVTKTGSFSGTVVSATETATTTTTFGTYNTPVPARPTAVTATNVRSGSASQSATTQFTYTASGLPASQVAFAGLAKAVTTTNTYNSFGNLTQAVTSATGLGSRTAKFTYDGRGTFLIKKEATGTGVSQSESYTYDYRWGKPLSQISPDCLTTTFEYDGFGRLKKTNLPEGYSINTTLVWDVQGQTVFYAFTDYPGGSPDTKAWYDRLGRQLKQSTAGFNNQWRTQLTTTTTYDAYNRPISASNTLGTTTYAYVKLSGARMQHKTTAGGKTTYKWYDATGKVIRTDDNGGTMNFTYDSRGNQLSAGQNGTTLITNTFDAYGRQLTLTDKNAGAVSYDYDAYGQLEKQTDANGNIYNMAYDDLGRITSRQGPEGPTTYEYYKNITTGCSNNNLAKVTGFNGVIKEYAYNSLQRLQSEKVTVDGVAYTTQFSYDTYGNLTNTTYPSGVVVNNSYDANGGLLTVSGGTAGAPTTLFTATAVNGFGQYTGYTLGNGKASQNTYNYGAPTRLYTAGVQDLNLTFDLAKGILTSRRDAIRSITESFTHDNLNRLTGSKINGVQQLTMTYDGTTSSSMGNIITKTDAGAYTYKTDKIHAVAYITNPADALTPPSTISTTEQQISYTPFLKTATITEGAYNLSYTYGPEYQRVKSILKQGTSTIETRYYLGSYEKQVGGTTREIHYVSGGNGLCAMIVREGGVNDIYFVYTDHLGSLLTVTNSAGTIVAEQNFDAWGRNRNPATWQYTAGAATPTWLYRGYTGHELVPHFALINMNGRMYDPVQGRMLSPDNYVPTPFGTQGYNRYAYALNNPLTITDPEGNFIWFVVAAAALVGGVANGVAYANNGKSFLGGFWRGALVGGGAALTGGAIAGALPGLGGAVLGGMAGGIVNGGLGSALNGGNVAQGIMVGAMTGAVGGGATSFAMYYGMNYYNYSKSSFKGVINYRQFSRMGGDYQRSLIRHKEFGGIVSDNGKYYRAPARFRHNFSVDYDPAWLSKIEGNPLFSFHTHWAKEGINVIINNNMDFASDMDVILGRSFSATTSDGPSPGDWEYTGRTTLPGILVDRSNVINYFLNSSGIQATTSLLRGNLTRHNFIYWPW